MVRVGGSRVRLRWPYLNRSKESVMKMLANVSRYMGAQVAATVFALGSLTLSTNAQAAALEDITFSSLPGDQVAGAATENFRAASAMGRPTSSRWARAGQDKSGGNRSGTCRAESGSTTQFMPR